MTPPDGLVNRGRGLALAGTLVGAVTLLLSMIVIVRGLAAW